ncbi:MAG: hypothetical protein ACXWUH_20235 [Burkholderiales bacterium]
MTTHMNRCFTNAGLALALLCGPAFAASSNDAGKSQRGGEKAAERAEPKQQQKTVRQDFASCRREARNMDGPERARFMTRCLHESR